MRSGVVDLFPKDKNRETEVSRGFRFFEDYEEPLFGRADEKLTLQPFKTDVLKDMSQ